MSIKQQIQAWLADRNADYSIGLGLYNVVKISKNHDAFLAGEHDKNSMQFNLLKNNLVRALQKIQVNGEPEVKLQTAQAAQAQPATVKKIQVRPLNPDAPVVETSTTHYPSIVVRNPNIRISDNPYVPIHLLPAEIQQLYKENKSLHPIANKLHSDLKREEDPEKCQALLAELLKTDKIIRSNWATIDDWAQINLKKEDFQNLNNENKNTNITADIVIKLKRRTSLLDMIAREKRNIAKGSMKANTKFKANVRLDKWAFELAALEKELNLTK